MPTVRTGHPTCHARALPYRQEGTPLQLIDGKPVFSATDLVGYLACEHLTELERAALAGLVERPHRSDRELDVIRRRGFQHEARYLAQLEAEGRSVVRIERDDDETRGAQIRRQAAETIAAMEGRAEVIYQATFFDGRWLGYADFLLRIDDPDPTRASVWGPWHYAVADTKLARHVKAGAVLQLCSYVEQLTALQGVQPTNMLVVLGGGPKPPAELRVDDYMAYYRAAKRRFEEVVLADAPPIYPPSTYPEPVEHCEVCRWSEVCAARRRKDDHLSLVAHISGRQRKALVGRGVTTLAELGKAPIPFDPPLDGTSASSIERVREQARIQLEGRVEQKYKYEMFEPAPGAELDPERGLATLPQPHPGDLFLDLEGDPYAFDEGIDYLFGLMDTQGNYTALWSVDPDGSGDVTLAGEKHAFEQLMDALMEQFQQYPEMHVYHYAGYEPTALKRLMGRHATREEEVDKLLRGGVLVDLYRAVTQGLRASVESYSLKKIEPLYEFERSEGLRDAGSSIVEFEEWLELADTDRPTSQILESIAAYNRDDVRSTAALREWLERLRVELTDRTGLAVPRPSPRSPEAPAQLSEADAAVQVIADSLTDGVPADRTERTDEQHARWLLAQLLSWHRREAKVAFWEFFDRMAKDGVELTRDRTALGPLEPVGEIGEPWRETPKSMLRKTWRYRFSTQDHDIGLRDEVYDPRLYREQPDAKWSTWKVRGKLLAIDDANETVDIGWPADKPIRHPEALNPLNMVGDKDQRKAVRRLGEWVVTNGIDADGPWRAARDLLLGRPPRCGQADGAPLKQQGELELDAAIRLGLCLTDGVLAIQGPPGAGKTYTGARMVARLLAEGRKVGISSTSHKVISHFLKEICKAAREASPPIQVRAVQKISEGHEGVPDRCVTVTEDNGQVREGLADGTFNVAAGTAWLWAPEESDGLLDVLFVDEAGQISLANVLCMAGATRSIVMLGDPQQLEQPTQGSHPPGADRSALAHLLDGADTIPDHLGLFLDSTWRLHPAIAKFTSDAFYEGRLESRPGLERQSVEGREAATLDGSGVRLLAASHEGSDSESAEEAAQVAKLVQAIVKGSLWIDKTGQAGLITYEDVLIVAPYNAQVGAIRRALPQARVGTVDKFQGQEAPISIYSMTTSSPDLAPRGMDFLYSRHRLNVATSRARCIAVVVAQPALLRVRARNPEQMRLANALCQFVELAAQSASTVAPPRADASASLRAQSEERHDSDGPDGQQEEEQTQLRFTLA